MTPENENSSPSNIKCDPLRTTNDDLDAAAEIIERHRSDLASILNNIKFLSMLKRIILSLLDKMTTYDTVPRSPILLVSTDSDHPLYFQFVPVRVSQFTRTIYHHFSLSCQSCSDVKLFSQGNRADKIIFSSSTQCCEIICNHLIDSVANKIT